MQRHHHSLQDAAPAYLLHSSLRYFRVSVPDLCLSSRMRLAVLLVGLAHHILQTTGRQTPARGQILSKVLNQWAHLLHHHATRLAQ